MKMTNYQTIDAYIANFPDKTADVLQKIRKTILSTAPDAKEKISYGIPTFTVKGKNLIHFGGYDKFVSIYPGAQPVQVFATQLKNYKTSKGTIQFLLGEPIPYDLITEIAKYRLQQI